MQDLHPLACRRYALLVFQHVRGRRLEALVEDCTLGLQVVDLVFRAELEQTRSQFVILALLLLHLLVNLRNGLVAPFLVLFVGKRLDRLRVGVGEGRRKFGGPGPDGDRDQARMAHELQFGASQHLDEILVRHG